MKTTEITSMDMKTVLALNIHEVKNLMALLMLKLDAMNKENAEVGDARLLCHRVNDCMEQMLLLFELQSERLVTSMEAHSPSDFIEEFVQNAVTLAGSRIKIEMNIESAPAYWFFDRALIEMAMLNAVHNALRYANKSIVIGASLHNDELLLSIEDDGKGFPQAVIENPSELSANQRYEELGLGLFFAETIAKAHRNKARQGKLLLHNKRHGHGGVFTLHLP